MVFHGEQGSAKSTTTSTIKKIVDPSPENLASMPKKIDDLNIHLYNRYLSNFDNISYFDQEVSDNLCRAITGHTHIKRELYQDSKEVILSIQTRIILNGISPNIEFPDLMQRSIFYETKYIPKNEKLTEEEFNKKLNLLIPHLLDQIFNTISNTISIFEIVKSEIKSKERMADFTVYGECISRSLGFDNFTFLESYKHNLDSNSLGASESWPVIDIILDIIKNKKLPFEIAVGELYSQITTIADTKNIDRKTQFSKFPKTVSSFSGQLTRFNEVFRNTGYQLLTYRYNLHDGKFKRGKSILKVASSTPIQSKIVSKERHEPDEPTSQDRKQAQKTSKPNTGLKKRTRANEPRNKSDKNDKKPLKTNDEINGIGTGHDTDTGNTNQGHEPKNTKSSHKKDTQHVGSGNTGLLPTFDKENKNKKSVTKKDKKSIDDKSKKYTHFKCLTCNAGEFGLDDKGTNSDSILEFHKKQSHSIQYFNKKEGDI